MMTIEDQKAEVRLRLSELGVGEHYFELIREHTPRQILGGLKEETRKGNTPEQAVAAIKRGRYGVKPWLTGRRSPPDWGRIGETEPEECQQQTLPENFLKEFRVRNPETLHLPELDE